MDVVFTVIYGVIIETLRENSKDGSRRVGWQRDTPLVGLPAKGSVVTGG